MSACVLHNLILTRYPLASGDVDHEDQSTHAMIPGAWRDDPVFHGLRAPTGNTSIKEAKSQRVYLSHYYTSRAGAVSWQEKMIT